MENKARNFYQTIQSMYLDLTEEIKSVKDILGEEIVASSETRSPRNSGNVYFFSCFYIIIIHNIIIYNIIIYIIIIYNIIIYIIIIYNIITYII